MFSQFRKELVRKQTKLLNALQTGAQTDEIEYTTEEAIESKLEHEDEPEVYQFVLDQDQSLKLEVDDDQPQDEDELEDEIEALDECSMQMDFTTLTVTPLKTNDTIYQCDNCAFFGYSKAELTKHTTMHCSARTVIVLEECDASSGQEDSDIKPTYVCDMCQAEFKKRHLLNRHVRLKHTVKERQYACKHCDKSFFNGSNLKKHEESHNQKNLPCEFCDKLFTCMNNLRSHLYYHAEPKFHCSYEGCDKKFFMKKLLTAHLNVS